jgi:hypothetical protein
MIVSILWIGLVIALVIVVLRPMYMEPYESITMTQNLKTFPLSRKKNNKKKSYTGNVTVYEGSNTSSGINPKTYPVTLDLKGLGKKKVYPIAVHQKEYDRDKCKILRVRKGNTDFYGHVINRCKGSDPDCQNRFKSNANYLVDLYYDKPKDYTSLGLGNTINKGFTIQDTGYKASALSLPKKHWHSWLSKEHVTNPKWNCDLCC